MIFRIASWRRLSRPSPSSSSRIRSRIFWLVLSLLGTLVAKGMSPRVAGRSGWFLLIHARLHPPFVSINPRTSPELLGRNLDPFFEQKHAYESRIRT